MFKTNFQGRVSLASVAVAMSLVVVAGFAHAESEMAGQPSKGEATIGEMTRLAKQLKVEKIRKDLRETMGEAEKSADAAVSAATSPPPVPVKPVIVKPTAPGVVAVVGVGKELSAKLASGQRVGVGARVGDWRVVSIDSEGVAFQRCDAKRGRKGTRKDSAQEDCVTQFVAPGSIG